MDADWVVVRVDASAAWEDTVAEGAGGERLKNEEKEKGEILDDPEAGCC